MSELSSQAIRDGVIEAAMDDAAGTLYTKESTDAYSTSEPQQAFDRRIKFCLDVHNDAVTVRGAAPLSSTAHGQCADVCVRAHLCVAACLLAVHRR